jgi:hypothetical protein
MIHPHSQDAEHRFLFLYNRGKLKLNDMYCSKYIIISNCLNSWAASTTARSAQWLGYGLDDSGLKSWWGKEIFSTPKGQDLLWGLPSLLFNRYQTFSPGIKQQRQEVDLSPPSSAKAKNVHAVLPLIQYAFMAWKRTALPSSVLPLWWAEAHFEVWSIRA